MRCVNEASLHQENAFLTLTYADQHLPDNGALLKSDLQKFVKRLRKNLGSAKPIRYYACGEYGDRTQRAHYHMCLFGHNFPDRKELSKSGEHTLYVSQALTNIWGLGNTSIGELTFETAAYTARYCMKKYNGKKGEGFVTLDDQTGELIPLAKPFSIMSLKPAIGHSWLTKYHSDIYGADKDSLVMRGKKLKPARYYDKIYDTINPDHMEWIKHLRQQENKGHTTAELQAMAKISRSKYFTKKAV